MFFTKISSVALFAALSSAISLGPGPVVTVTLCNAEQTCSSSPLRANQCVDLSTTDYNNNLVSFKVGPVFSTAPKINCTIYDLKDCNAGAFAPGKEMTIQSPGGELESAKGGKGFSKLASSYFCD